MNRWCTSKWPVPESIGSVCVGSSANLRGWPSSSPRIHRKSLLPRSDTRVVCPFGKGRVVPPAVSNNSIHDPPSPDLAWCLGPVNWVGNWAGDQILPDWLEGHSAARRCYRPEEVGACWLLAIPEFRWVVQSASFSGSVAEVELRDERSGQTRRVFHRPAAARLHAGQRVLLKVLLLLLATLFLAGCTQAAAEPQLAIRYKPTVGRFPCRRGQSSQAASLACRPQAGIVRARQRRARPGLRSRR